MYNFTLIGDPINGSQTVSTNGMLLRRGTAATIRNFVVQGFNRSGIDIDNTPTMLNAQNGEITVSNSIWWMNDDNAMNFYNDADDLDVASYPFTTRQFMTGTMQNNLEADPLLPNPYDWTDPDFRPAANSPAGNGTVPVAAPPQGNNFIEVTNYIGAIDPNGDDWTRKPWTTFGPRQGGSTTTIANTTTSTVISTSTTTVLNSTTTVSNTTTTVSKTTTTVSGTTTTLSGITTTVPGTTTTSIAPESTTTTVSLPPPDCTDNDNDGYAIEGGTCGAVDCADNDAAINPGAEEVCRDKKDNNCNGEVDENCKLCASSQLLGAGNPQLDILRYYRDTVMARSLKGRIYTKLYYAYSDQVSEILEADPALKAQTAALLASALPAVERALESKTVMFTDTQKEQSLAVLNKIGKKASFGLRLVIMIIKSDIKSGSAL
jgi:hypothetical protein